MRKVQKIGFFLGRVFLSMPFVMAGIKKLLYWGDTRESVLMKFCALKIYFPDVRIFELFIQFMPMLLGLAIFLELAGAFLLISGYFFRMGAIFLLLFLIPTTILYHDFWFQIGDKRVVELTIFMKNLALIGSLLLLLQGPQFKKQER